MKSAVKKHLATIIVLLLTATPAFARDVQLVLRIDGITCPFCVAASEKDLRKIDGVKGVSSSLKDGTITICVDDEKVRFTDRQLTKLFREKGFTYRGMKKGGACDE